MISDFVQLNQLSIANRFSFWLLSLSITHTIGKIFSDIIVSIISQERFNLVSCIKLKFRLYVFMYLLWCMSTSSLIKSENQISKSNDLTLLEIDTKLCATKAKIQPKIKTHKSSNQLIKWNHFNRKLNNATKSMTPPEN